MIPNNMWPKDVVHAYHLRATATSEHGSKDWICVLSHNPRYSGKLWVVFGKTDEVMSGGGQGRQRTNDPATEDALKAAVKEKLNGKDEYIIIDEYEARCGWHSQPSSKPTAQAQPAAPSPKPPSAAKAAKPPTPPAAKAPTNVLEEEDCGEPTMCW